VGLETGSHALSAFGRKVRAFEEWLTSGACAQALGPESFKVAVLTHSARRLENLCRVARDELERERWDAYLFGTFEVLEAEDAAAGGWTTLDGEEVPLLPDEAWPEEPEPDGAV
jgi:hypothetical protein